VLLAFGMSKAARLLKGSVGVARDGLFKKKSITNYITNYFYTKKLALSIEVIG